MRSVAGIAIEHEHRGRSILTGSRKEPTAKTHTIGRVEGHGFDIAKAEDVECRSVTDREIHQLTLARPERQQQHCHDDNRQKPERNSCASLPRVHLWDDSPEEAVNRFMRSLHLACQGGIDESSSRCHRARSLADGVDRHGPGCRTNRNADSGSGRCVAVGRIRTPDVAGKTPAALAQLGPLVRVATGGATVRVLLDASSQD